MNKIVLFFVVLSGIVLGVGCNQAPKADQAQVQEAHKLRVLLPMLLIIRLMRLKAKLAGWLLKK